NARSTPEPFKVVNCKENFFQNWTDHLSPYFAKDCPFPTRPLRELKVEQLKPGYFLYRNTYTGAFTEIGVQQKKGKETEKQKKTTKTAKGKPKEPTEMPPPPPPLPPYSLNTLSVLYNGLLPLSRGKIKDIMHLKRFCGPAAQVFNETLVAKETDSGESDLSDCGE
ncbi:hypothetical protein J6590_093750, partial [Homalodisca vitripennis]